MWPPPKASIIRVSTSTPSFFSIASLKVFGGSAGHARQIAEDLRSLGVHLLHPRIIGRHRRRAVERVLLELLEVRDLEIRIELPLVADGALQAVANVRAARRAVAVRGEDHHAVRQREEVVAQRVKELLRQLLRLARAEQIRPAGGVHKERVAREHAPRRVGVILLRDDVAHMLRRVAGRVPDGDDRLAKGELIAVRDLFVIEAVVRVLLRG